MRIGFFARSRTRIVELVTVATAAVLPIVASAQPYGDFGQTAQQAGQSNGRAVASPLYGTEWIREWRSPVVVHRFVWQPNY